MTSKTEIRVFIASPGDTDEQRALVSKYIGEWNDTFGDDRSIVLKDIGWKKDLSPRSGIDTQTEINNELVEYSDIMIGFFWTRFGTPTKNDKSGTVEEIKFFLKRKRPIILYFIEKPVNPSKLDIHQIEEIRKFKEEYKNENIYGVLDTEECTNFRSKFIKDLNRSIKLLTQGYETTDGKEPTNNSGNNGNGAATDQEKEWFKISIKDLIEKRLAENDLPLVYRRYICFNENTLLWQTFVDSRHEEVRVKILGARQYAFDKKYGKYDYQKDLREKYQNEWPAPIIAALTKYGFGTRGAFKVLGVGSNSGIELKQIFKNFSNANLEVLDLSNEAILAGKKNFKDIKYWNGNMENSTLPNASYDVYLNLRSIHSSGVDIRMTLAECFRLLKTGGLAVFSISNGYLTENEARKGELVETKGMYDNKEGAFSTNRPYELVNKVRNKLDDYGFKEVELHTGQTEIFLTAIR